MDELHLDLLCYLREQSKWDKRAMDLFDRLMNKTTITWRQENEKH